MGHVSGIRTATPRPTPMPFDSPIVLSLTVMAKLQSSPSPPDHPAPQPLERGALRRTSSVSPAVSASRKHTHIKVRKLSPPATFPGSSALWRSWRTCSSGLAHQRLTDQLRQAELLALRLVQKALVDFARQPECYGHAAFWQVRSGHETTCIIVSYTMSTLNYLALEYDV